MTEAGMGEFLRQFAIVGEYDQSFTLRIQTANRV